MRETPLLAEARSRFHSALFDSGVLALNRRNSPKRSLPVCFPSNADGDSATSITIAQSIFDQLRTTTRLGDRLAGQIAGSQFEQITRTFLETTFLQLSALRPGKWVFNPESKSLGRFEQYSHLAQLAEIAKKTPEIAASLGHDYVISPDVVILRMPEPDSVINQPRLVVDSTVGLRSPIRRAFNQASLLHASISCKWTLRSDRAQNARSEALNLIRNRKGRAPHIAVVTGEPLPSRIASLALGTGDIDCVYHFALPELIQAVRQPELEEAANLVRIMVDGKRLKDIADLPLDLAV